jgi:cobalt-zinc-cadmium resistance protein CzcA
MNGILIITYFNEVRLSGVRGVAAMQRAAEQRMRPMLMTALSACIGLFPAAVSHGIGSQVQRPLATVIVGGMLLGPILLLVVVPALQMSFLGRNPDPEPGSPQATGAPGNQTQQSARQPPRAGDE